MSKNDNVASSDPLPSDPEKKPERNPPAMIKEYEERTAIDSHKSTKTAAPHLATKSVPTSSEKPSTSTNNSAQDKSSDEKSNAGKSQTHSRTQPRLALADVVPFSIKGSMSTKKRKLNLKEFIHRHFQRGAASIDYDLWELNALITMARNVFEAGPSLVEFRAPVYVCGDIHGQYTDLIRIFYTCGPPGKVKYLFLGDYVDRGHHCLEVISLLLACKIRYPKQMILLRGNHEVKKTNSVYGFKEELKKRFKDVAIWSPLYDNFNDVFAEMPLAALISNSILCMHGGLSPELNTLEDLRNIQRPIHTLSRGLVQDLLWADPERKISGFKRNTQRLVSVYFGEDVVFETLKRLKLQLIIRAHQIVSHGYSFFANERLITVFSASRYNNSGVNWGGVVHVDAELECTFKVFKPLEYDIRNVAKQEDTADTADGDEDDGPHFTEIPSAAQAAIAWALSRG